MSRLPGADESIAKTTEHAIPNSLKKWLSDREVDVNKNTVVQETFLNESKKIDNYGEPVFRYYVLSSIKLKYLCFTDNRFNPRIPNEERINELAASIKQLSLLTPLTCVCIEDTEFTEEVLLVDGRHRFEALKLIREMQKDSGETLIDVKIFFELEKSDALLMANYLNRSRRQLKPAEYYGSVARIYHQAQKELMRKNINVPSEEEIFKYVSDESLKNKNLDLSIGRIVGDIINEEENGDLWYNYVGIDQNSKTNNNEYKPMTAGVLFHLLKNLCYKKPYTKNESRTRSVEIDNCLQLGAKYEKIVFTKLMENRDETTATYVACKTFVTMAFGEILEYCVKVKDENYIENQKSVFCGDVDWTLVEKVLMAFMTTMEGQAKLVNEYYRKKDLTILKGAWSHQTQKDQIKTSLIPEMGKILTDIDFERLMREL